jgi:hypothetical protein
MPARSTPCAVCRNQPYRIPERRRGRSHPLPPAPAPQGACSRQCRPPARPASGGDLGRALKGWGGRIQPTGVSCRGVRRDQRSAGAPRSTAPGHGRLSRRCRRSGARPPQRAGWSRIEAQQAALHPPQRGKRRMQRSTYAITLKPRHPGGRRARLGPACAARDCCRPQSSQSRQPIPRREFHGQVPSFLLDE